MKNENDRLREALRNLLILAEEDELRIDGEWGYGHSRAEFDAGVLINWPEEILAARVVLQP